MKINLDDLAKYFFVLSLCILMFVYGYLCRQKFIFPYHHLVAGFHQLEKYIPLSRPHHLYPIRYSESGVKVHSPDKIMPGITLLTSFWPKTDGQFGITEVRAGIRLIDINGKTLHHWEVSPKEIWPESPHQDHEKNSLNTNGNYVHGTYLFPNGDVVFNVEYMGLVRMNSAGEVLWKLPYRTHHSVFYDEEGSFWVPGLQWIEKGDQRIKLFPGLKVPFTEATILKVSPEGKILNKISLLEALYNSNNHHFIRHYRFQEYGDVLHLNDVEVLSSQFAEHFPLFNQGDLVASLRHGSTLVVLGQTGKIKWISTGVFTRQHDPDFEPDGWITVFDNRMNLGRTWIRKINPLTGEVKTLYPTKPDQDFYSQAGGKHQKLSNGNRLITEARAGRVFEITPEGETVWEWIQQPYDEKYVSEVLEGTRYELTEKDIANWKKTN